jgi:DNA repair protein RecN (Recombination protein N)
MLSHLSISNYALIDELDISFSEGFTIITGETGAGKSILLGALSLILGQRADTQVLLDKKKKCVVEGTFNIKGYGLQNFFADNELDYEDHTVIRREINQNGKSRAFINDTPVNLDLLNELGENLVDIHSQHKTLTLQSSKFQLAFVDAYVQHDELLNSFGKEFTNYNKLKTELSGLLEKEKQSKSDQDYFQFQYDELNAAGLKEGEQESLEKELEFLNHSEEIKTNLTKASSSLTSGDYNLTSGFKEVENILRKMAALHPGLDEIAKRIESCNIELKDIATEIESIEQKIIYSPERINEINERLDIIYHLQQKHRVNTIKELIEIKDNISDKLSSITTLDIQIEKHKKQISVTENNLTAISEKLTKNRKKAIPLIEKGVMDVLKKLAMPNAEFNVSHSLLTEYNSYGKDKISFLFNANKGGELKELSKVASGGELSRLMLSIKSLISVKKLLPTIIFDEIDQGVSGDIADKVGSILKNISATMQVITITHLPQIAGKGTHHCMVYKETGQHTTFTKIKTLSEKERVTEIAKMLSGNDLTKAALENARSLLKN